MWKQTSWLGVESLYRKWIFRRAYMCEKSRWQEVWFSEHMPVVMRRDIITRVFQSIQPAEHEVNMGIDGNCLGWAWWCILIFEPAYSCCLVATCMLKCCVAGKNCAVSWIWPMFHHYHCGFPYHVLPCRNPTLPGQLLSFLRCSQPSNIPHS